MLLEEDLATEPQLQEMATHITTAARRGQTIVAQLMSYTRQGMTSDKDFYLPVSFDALIRENMILLQPCIRPSTQMIYTKNANTDIVLANATQIGQVLVNLCINADHAMGIKTGLIDINLNAHFFEKSIGSDTLEISEKDEKIILMNGRLPAGDYIICTIKDDGEGMNRQTARRIFEPFFTTKDVGRGTGLGLAAIQGIVHAHHGAIRVTTEKFKGTSFDIILPSYNTSALADGSL